MNQESGEQDKIKVTQQRSGIKDEQPISKQFAQERKTRAKTKKNEK